MKDFRDTWLAQSVEQATLDLRVEFKPHVGHRVYLKKEEEEEEIL